VQERPDWQSPSGPAGFAIVQMTPLWPSKQTPLKLLHWFWHSWLRAHGWPSGCGSMQLFEIWLHTLGEAQSPSAEQGAPLPPGVHRPPRQRPLKQSLLKSQ
jgi:hypothetical protein